MVTYHVIDTRNGATLGKLYSTHGQALLAASVRNWREPRAVPIYAARAYGTAEALGSVLPYDAEQSYGAL